MNYKRIFDTASALQHFKAALTKLNEERRPGFYKVLIDAYLAKQNSERDDLPTYKITKAEVDSFFQAYA